MSLTFVQEFTGTSEFPAQTASNAENVFIWWRHHGENDVTHVNTELIVELVFIHTVIIEIKPIYLYVLHTYL